MYMPQLARFSARDPLSETGVELLRSVPSFSPEHPYAYARNNPVRYVDPSRSARRYLRS